MFAPLPFALHATTGCPPHAELALSLACSFEDLDAMAVDADLEALTRHLPPPVSSHPLAELKSLARVGPRGDAPDDIGTDGLRLCLPFDENGKRAAGRRLERVRARLN